jgi:hypothetical protein
MDHVAVAWGSANRIVVQDIDPAECRDGLVDQGVDLRRGGDVDLDGHGLSPRFGYVARHPAGVHDVGHLPRHDTGQFGADLARIERSEKGFDH